MHDYFDNMNNKQLNREFNQMLIEKKKFNNKSGFTDSEDDDENSKCLLEVFFFAKLIFIEFTIKKISNKKY